MGVSIGIDELVALNDEIAALVRAGVPLERGLLGLGRDVPGRLGAIARELGSRMERGATLEEALTSAGPAIPETYRAVVEAGRRSGRLPAALEGLASYARGYAELRRVVGAALLYPVMVMLLGYVLLLGFLWLLLPRIGEAFEVLEVVEPGVVRALERVAGTVVVWGPVLPILVAAGALGWWFLGRARGLDAVSALGWVPWLGSALRDARAANFASWLGLMLEQGVPLAEGLELAGRASGDRALDGAAREWAAAARRGATLEGSRSERGGAPPLLRWLLGEARMGDRLLPALRHVAERYRSRAVRKAQTMATIVPSLLLLFIGGMTALMFTMVLVVPWTSLLHALTRPPL